MYNQQGPIISEPQYICDVCGRKRPVSQMIGKCSKCGCYVCSSCGQLKNDKIYCAKHVPSCFIATAAYGTSMCTEIDVLRDFRNTKLNTNPTGKALVRLYYEVSPPIAEVIARSKRMRALVRINLSPIIKSFKTIDKSERANPDS